MQIDVTSELVLHAQYNRRNSSVAIITLAAFATLCLAFALSQLPFQPRSTFRDEVNSYIGWAGVIVSAWIIWKVLWAHRTHQDRTLTLNPNGFHDRRITASPIKWSEVKRVSKWGKHPALAVKIRNDAWKEIPIHYESRLLRFPNMLLTGQDVLIVSLFTPRDSSLTSVEDLHQAFLSYAEAHGVEVA